MNRTGWLEVSITPSARRIAVGALMVACTGACGSEPNPAVIPGYGPTSVSTSGTSQVVAVPDTVTAHAEITSTAADVRAALSDAQAGRKATADALIRGGVAAADVDTSQPAKLTAPAYATPGAGPPQVFSAVAPVTLRLRLQPTTNQLLDALIDTVKSGSTQTRITGVGYSIADATSLLSNVQNQAAKNARDAAQRIVTLSGKTLRDLINVNPDSDQPQLTPRAPGAPATELILAPNQHLLRYTVTGTWEMV